MLLDSLKTSNMNRAMKVTFAKALCVCAEDPTSRITILDRLKVLLSFQSIAQFKQPAITKSGPISSHNSSVNNFEELEANPNTVDREASFVTKRKDQSQLQIQKNIERIELDINYPIDKIVLHLKLRILLV